jgi:hypothetical protein
MDWEKIVKEYESIFKSNEIYDRKLLQVLIIQQQKLIELLKKFVSQYNERGKVGKVKQVEDKG